MRIRWPFAAGFLCLILLSAYIGLLPHNDSPSVPAPLHPNDKVLHVVTFFFLTLLFYWIPDTSRRRTLHLTLLLCSLALGVGSEFIQGLLPNGRDFDLFDLVANLVGSLAAVALCSWYHKRMLERRRKARFGAFADAAGAGDDVELGVGPGHGHDGDNGDNGDALGPQETGVTSLEQEVDNWDENAVDNWDEDEDAADAAATRRDSAKSSGGVHGEDDGKKRSD